MALRHDPDCIEAHKRLGSIMVCNNELDVAEAHLIRANNLSPHPDDVILDWLTVCRQFKGDLEGALEVCRARIQAFPSQLDAHEAMAECLFRLGDDEKAMSLFRAVFDIKLQAADEIAARHGTAPVMIVGDMFVYKAIGEMFQFFDMLVKARGLKLLPNLEFVFLNHERVFLNEAALHYWGRHVTIVGDADEIADLRERHKPCVMNWEFFPLGDEPGAYRESAWHAINYRWVRQGRAPLLKLGEKHRRDGRRTLARMGVPEDAWFVTFHIRESGFHAEKDGHYNNPRNSRVEDYFPAMRRVVERGGWVVRIGDRTMTPLPPMENVVDYATSDFKDPWMDLFLSADCRFFVATQSGMAQLPPTFGTPIVFTNYFAERFYRILDGDLFIHRILHNVETGEDIDFRTMFNSPLVDEPFTEVLAKRGIEIRPNTADEIVEVVDEMFRALEGSQAYDNEDDRLAERYFQAVSYRGRHSMGRPGQAFLRRYQYLF